ncbi:MAG: hypothetical protein DBY45_10230 [Clostridiales bacterium]|nr:MAG: hypothetical protein DBY45_10230 [Clostridiales bacterium]
MIDADKVYPNEIFVLGKMGQTDFNNAVKSLINYQPVVDPVHAVGACYCWECKHYNKPRLGFCSVHMDRENPDDFCSYGEREEKQSET